MSEKKRLIKNTGLIALGNFGSKMISFFLLPLYTSILDSSEYGDYDFIIAVSLFLLPIATLSMYEAMFRFIIESVSLGKKFDSIISNAFYAETIGLIVMGVGCIPVYVFTGTVIVWYVFLYVAASSYYLLVINMLRGQGKIKEFAIASSLKNILQLIMNVVAVAVLRWGMDGLVFALCMSEVISFVAVAVYVKIWNNIRLKYVSYQKMKEMLVYSLPLIPNALSSQVINISDRIIITQVMGSGSNGIYAVSYKFPNIIDTVYHFFYTAWSESASRVFEKSREEANKYYQSLHETMDNFMFAIIALMVSGMPIAFRIFVRNNFVEGFKYVPVLMFAMYFASISKIYSGIFTAYKKTETLAVSTFCAAIVNIVINIAFIYKFGLYAAAYSTLIANIVLMMFRKGMLKKDIDLKIPIHSVIERVLVVIIVFALYDYNDWQKTIISIAVCSIYAIYSNRKTISSIL